MNRPRHSDYVPEAFWQERYSRIDLTRSGHRDLPEPYNRWLYRRKRAVLRRTLLSSGLRLPGARLLELGVGTGAYLELWRRLGVGAVVGVDISASATEHLRKQHPDCVALTRDITRPGLSTESGGDYDLVVALDVLYHVVDDSLLSAALENAREVLKPGGLLAFHDQFLHRPSESHGYIRWRSLVDWTELLCAAGFETVARVPIFFVMIQPNDCRTPNGAARMDALWDITETLLRRAPRIAGALGAALDASLGRLLDEGPSMELMLARRVR